MTLRRKNWRAFLYILPCMVALACPSPGPDGTEPPTADSPADSLADSAPERAESPPAEPTPEQAFLSGALTLHASFDEGPDADFALGDPLLYTVPLRGDPDQPQPGLENADVEIVTDVGRFGSALRFIRRNAPAVFYRAEEKVAYSEDDWSGTVSFWLSLTPSEDLAPGYCDPIQITDESYDDAAVWVDFTNANPRRFRLGVFGDLEAWDPEDLSSENNPAFQERLVVVDELPFRRGEWTHVVVTFSGLGSALGGTARLYLDGALQGVIEDLPEPFSWDLPRAQIRLGVNYVGLFDELALFDRPLSEAEVLALHTLGGGIAAIHP
jgi:hypothetical protein